MFDLKFAISVLVVTMENGRYQSYATFSVRKIDIKHEDAVAEMLSLHVDATVGKLKLEERENCELISVSHSLMRVP